MVLHSFSVSNFCSRVLVAIGHTSAFISRSLTADSASVPCSNAVKSALKSVPVCCDFSIFSAVTPRSPFATFDSIQASELRPTDRQTDRRTTTAYICRASTASDDNKTVCKKTTSICSYFFVLLLFFLCCTSFHAFVVILLYIIIINKYSRTHSRIKAAVCVNLPKW